MNLVQKSKTIKDELNAFLKECNLLNSDITFLPSDASTRHYIRIENEQKLVMHAPPSEKPDQFIALSDYLNEKGLKAPKIFHANKTLHYYLIEDFGNLSFHDCLEHKTIPASDLYMGATDVLKHLYRSSKERPFFLMEYDENILLNEALLFWDWYVELTFQSRNPSAKIEYQNAIKELISLSKESPKTLTLRDYHIDNIMILIEQKGITQFGLIDFQDALWGPAGYDLISLTDDARIDVDPLLKEKMIDSYLTCFDFSQQQKVLDAMTVMNTIRQLKILGIFKRLYLRDHKSYYLKHLPRVERLLKECLLSPLAKPLYEWMKTYEFSLFI